MTKSHRNVVLGLLTTACGLAAYASSTRQSPGRYSFRGRTVVITGGSRGLGFALASAFAAEGARLVLLARTSTQLDEAARRLRAAGATSVRTLVCDVRDAAAVEEAVREVIRVESRIDVLVNNAGIIQVTPFEHAQKEDFEASLAVHFWAPLGFIRACLPMFSRQGGGRVINVASIGGRLAVPHLLPYCVGKFALVALSSGLRAELAGEKVHVTTVTPHLMRTGSHRNVTVRGQHSREATLFALGTATSLTAVDAERAARLIVEACRNGRACVSPGWPARLAELVQAMAPELTARLFALVAAGLPRPIGAEGDVARRSKDIDLRPVSRIFASADARRFNQRLASDER